MPSIQNKTFDEIKVGDTAWSQRTLQARDVRAWATAFGDAGALVEAGDVQDTAGIVTAILTSLAGSALPGQKRDICQNAIGFALALGIKLPKVAVLAAVETVSTKMPASLDGAILAKMADRRQIVGGIVDGPLDLDAAVDAAAARIKQISSPVAGAADVLVVSNIETGNMVYKNLAFMADAQTAGLVVGARVPVVLTSRADAADVRRFSAAAALYAAALARDPASILPEIED